MAYEKAIAFKKGNRLDYICVRNSMISKQCVETVVGKFDYLVFKLDNRQIKYICIFINFKKINFIILHFSLFPDKKEVFELLANVTEYECETKNNLNNDQIVLKSKYF